MERTFGAARSRVRVRIQEMGAGRVQTTKSFAVFGYTADEVAKTIEEALTAAFGASDEVEESNDSEVDLGPPRAKKRAKIRR